MMKKFLRGLFGILLLISITLCFIYLIIGLIWEASSYNYCFLFEIILWLLTIISIVVVIGAIVLIWLLYFLNEHDEKRIK